MSDHSNNEGPFDNNRRDPNYPGSQQTNQQDSQNQQYSNQQAQYNHEPYNNQEQYSQGQHDHNQYGQGQHNQAPHQQGQYTQAPYNQGQYGQGQYGQYPPPGGYPYPPPMYVPKKTNTKSIVGLILGVASIILPYIGFFIGIAGIIVNALSLKEIKNTHEEGKGLAIGGLVTSILGTVLYLIIIIFLIFVFAIVAESNNYYY